MKKLLILIAGAVGASLVKKKLDEQKAERDLWSEATDSSTGTAGPPSSPSTPPV